MLDEELTLHDYLRILRRRWWVIIAALIGCAGFALLYSLLQTRLYSSTAEILVTQASGSDIFDPNTGQFGVSSSGRQIANEARFIESTLMRDAVAPLVAPALAEGLFQKSPLVAVRVSTDGDADVLKVTATTADPIDSSNLANVYADQFIVLRQERAVAGYRSSVEVIQANIVELETQIAGSQGSDKTTLEQQRLTLIEALNTLDITADLAQRGSAQVITPAVPRPTPVSPQTLRNVLLGLILGALAGAGAALALNSLDRSIGSKQDIEMATGGLTNLAIVPTVREWKNRDSTRIISIEEPNSATAEAYRGLRAALQFVAVDQDLSVIQLTSANPGEGKTTTSVNLAVAMAKAGLRVALVDADLRKPRVHAFFGLNPEPGLTSVIIGQADVASTCQVVDDKVGLLAVMPSGPIPPGPSELLGSRRAQQVFTSLRGLADIVIVDSPPVLPVSDALVLSSYVDATLLVANGSRTEQGELRRALDLLEQVEARVVGTILNQVKKGSGGTYGYGYGYGYDAEATAAANRRFAVPKLPNLSNRSAEGQASKSAARSRPEPQRMAPAEGPNPMWLGTEPPSAGVALPPAEPQRRPAAQPPARSDREPWEEDTAIVIVD